MKKQTKHEWSLEEKKSLQRYIQEKKINEKKSRKKSEWLWDIFERQTKPV